MSVETKIDNVSDKQRFEDYYLYMPHEIDLERVVDGDTYDLEVKVDIGFNTVTKVSQRFRIHGVDTWEIYGVKASTDEYQKGKTISQVVREKLEELISNNKLVMQTFVDTGKYGRYIARFYWEEDGELKDLTEWIKSEMDKIEEKFESDSDSDNET